MDANADCQGSPAPSSASFKTNLRYGALLSKAVKRYEELGARRRTGDGDSARKDGRGVGDCWSPTSLSPLTTPDSTPPGSPAAVTVPLGAEDGWPVPLAPAAAASHAASATKRARSESLPEADEAKAAPRTSDGGRGASPAGAPCGPSAKSALQKEKSQAGAARRRAAKRRREGADADPTAKVHGPPLKHTFCVVEADDFNVVEYKVGRGAYVGRQSRKKNPSGVWTATALDRLGFAYLPWDGRRTYLILDEEGRVAVVLLGQPKEDSRRPREKTWAAVSERLAARFEAERVRVGHLLVGAKGRHGRGKFEAVNMGLSFGGGQQVPGQLQNGVTVDRMCVSLQKDPDLVRIAGYQSEGLAEYFPKAYDHMRKRVRQVLDAHPGTHVCFKSSAYPTSTVNLGPRTVCRGHNDCSNYPGIPCAITALGQFNPDEGGDLYLRDLKLRVRFPPSSSAILSSSGIRHGNVPIKADERRYSFTQYCPGGLIRWAAYGCRLAGGLSDAERDRLDASQGEGWEAQLSRFSKAAELKRDRAWLREQEAHRQRV